MEYFSSIQGEGHYSGYAAFFIRLGGCDVGCPWCDVKESWDASKHPHLSSLEITNLWKKSAIPVVVITGGEPAMYDLSELCRELKKEGALLHIETSGAYELKGEFDWITLSPKKFKPPVPQVLDKADELKVIVFNKSDLDWAEQHEQLVPGNTKLFLQPEWGRQEAMSTLIFDYIRMHTQWRISLQIHKFLGVD
jgi:organic radical activating enzyme